MYGISNSQQQSGGGSSGGGGSANYTKIESTIPTTAWVSSTPSWIGQNALTWSVHEGVYYTQGGTEDLGLSAGGAYSAVLTIDGTDYEPEYSEAMDQSGMIVYVAQFNSAVMLQIYDHCSGVGDSGPIAGNGYLVMVIPMSETVPSSIIVKSFSAAGGISAIISNSAIKVNSAVTMFIDYNGKIKAKEKTDGSVIVTASETPITAISYAIEITDTNTEGLFEIINNNFPIIPEIPDTKVGGEWQDGIFGTTTLGIGTYQIEVRGLYGIITIENETDATILDLPNTGMSDTSYVSDHFMIIRDATSGIMNASVIGIEYNITANEDGTTSYSIATINKSSFEGDDFRYRTLNF